MSMLPTKYGETQAKLERQIRTPTGFEHAGSAEFIPYNIQKNATEKFAESRDSVQTKQSRIAMWLSYRNVLRLYPR